MKAPAILCLYISIPLLIISLFFTIFFPWAIRRFQKLWYPIDEYNVKLPKNSFTMLSEELPTLDVVKTHYDINFNEYGLLLFHPVTTEVDQVESQINT